MEHIGSCNPWAVAWDLVALRPIQKGGCPRFFNVAVKKVGVPDFSVIQNLLNCDGLLPAQVKGAYWKLESTGGSVKFGDISLTVKDKCPKFTTDLSN